MTPDDPNNESLGSFRVPVSLLTVDPDADPLVGVCFNASYLPYVAGALKQLLLQATWDTSDPNALWLQQERIMNLIGQFSEGCPQMFFSGLIVGNAAASTPPVGWLPCDGSAVSRTTYASLFAAIGTTYGAGDGSTTFNVPDMRSRSPVGAGTGTGLSNRPLGSTGGEESVTLTASEMPSHNHGIFTLGGLAAAPGELPVKVPNVVTTDATANAGGGGAHDNMHPFLAINWLIKT